LLDATFRITVAFRQSHRLARAFIAPPSRETIAGTAKKTTGFVQVDVEVDLQKSILK